MTTATSTLPLRDRILAETVKILGTEGPAALTVRRVAALSGCSTIGVYTHFGSKAALVDAAIMEAFAGLDQAMAPIDSLRGVDRLLRGAHAYRDWALTHPLEYTVMFAPSITANDATDAAAQRGGLSLDDHVARTQDAVDRGELTGDTDTIARSIWSQVHGWVMTEILQSDPSTVAPGPEARAEFDASVRAVLVGFGATTPIDPAPAAHAPRRTAVAPASPYVDLDRAAWTRLSASTPLPLTDADVERLAGLGDPIDLAEVDAIYRPISRLLDLHIEATRGLHAASSTFLREDVGGTPFVIGVAGSVAVGKSTTARLLRELLARWPATPRVQLITTDGFLYPNAELERRGLMERKGFPESYDRRALLRFVSKVKAGRPEVRVPVYDHLTYDILPGREIVVNRPDVLIVEGLNVLQPARPTAEGTSNLAVSDFFDFSIYVDARTSDVRRWYVDRFLALRQTAFARPESYFHRYAALTDDEAVERAERIWDSINQPNLVQNILPTRSRATLVLTKDSDHAVERVRLRKL